MRCCVRAIRRCGMFADGVAWCALAEPVPVAARFAEWVGVLGAGSMFAGWRLPWRVPARWPAPVAVRHGPEDAVVELARRIASGEFRICSVGRGTIGERRRSAWPAARGSAAG